MLPACGAAERSLGFDIGAANSSPRSEQEGVLPRGNDNTEVRPHDWRPGWITEVQMNVRTAVLVVVCTALVAAVGCSSQLTAPSPTGTSQPSALAIGTASPPAASSSPNRFGPRTPGVVFVTSQGLYYDTFVVTDPLPMHGRFQLLVDGTTEFGPGDPGYLGGRWWEDLNGNGVQDPEDHFFLCPLLPPGRPTP
jgi:hypothetical protein